LRALAAAALLDLAAAAPATAEAAGNTRDRTLYISAYASQWFKSDLLEIPRRLLTGDLETRQATACNSTWPSRPSLRMELSRTGAWWDAYITAPAAMAS
jgi:hypothetical protein